MYVTLEVDIVKLIQESAESESIDDIFNEVIDKTIADQKHSEDAVIDIFLKNFDAIARPKGKTLLNYFETHDFRDISEDAIIKKLTTNADQAIDQAQEVIRQRIDQYGVSEPNINKSGARRIVLELPGVQNRNEMMSLLQTTARLEFHLVRNNENIVKAFAKIDKYLADANKRKKGVEVDVPQTETTSQDATSQNITSQDVTSQLATNDAANTGSDNTDFDTNATSDADTNKEVAQTDPTNPYEGLPQEEAQRRYLEDHPFTSIFSTFYFQGTDDNRQMVNFGYIDENIPDGDYMFRIPKDSMAKFNTMLNRNDIKTFLPIDIIIAVDAKPDQRILKQSNIEIFDFYALKKEPELTGDVITDARATFDPTTNQPVVSMAMNSDGAES